MLCRLLYLTFTLTTLVSSKCFAPAPAYPPLRDLPINHPTLQQAFQKLNHILNSGLRSPAGLDLKNSSWSVEVTSLQETIWTHYHTASNISPRGVSVVDGDTSYRIASISKTFTVLTALKLQEQGKLHFHEPVTKYLPELLSRAEGSDVEWDGIPVWAMITQQSGLRRENYAGKAHWDLASQLKLTGRDAVALGLPPFDVDEMQGCNGTIGTVRTTCDAKELLDDVKYQSVVGKPFDRATYCNANYCILGVLIERITGKSLEENFRRFIYEPAGMTSTSLDRPDDSTGAIPGAMDNSMIHDWDWDAGAQGGSGGLFSTASDLSKYARFILGDESLRRSWLKPATFDSDAGNYYGAPWEIYRTSEALPHSKRAVAFYVKAGGEVGYSSYLILVPELGIAFAILVAGDAPLFNWIRDEVTKVIVPAVDEIALAQLDGMYSGIYRSKSIDSEIQIRVDPDRAMWISKWTSNGTDFFGSLGKLGLRVDESVHLGLIATKIVEGKAQEGWRWMAVSHSKDRPSKSTGMWDKFCKTDIDGMSYGSLSIFDIRFERSEEDHEVIALEIPALRIRMPRISRAVVSNKRHGSVLNSLLSLLGLEDKVVNNMVEQDEL